MVAAFDDVFVYRYDAKTREAKEKIDVRYVFGPKHRVLHDLNDRAKSLTLPIVTMEQTSLSRDPSRVFNKDQHFYRPNGSDNKISKVPTPIPVNLEIDLSIITRYKEDLDQIIQNFVTQCNPYIIVSWKIPESFGMSFIDEIRSEIQWSGDVTYENPKDLSPDVKWRISANTSFTIKGWLFKSLDQKQEPIYTVRTDFKVANLEDRVYTYDDYNSLSGVDYGTDTVLVSAYPEFTNLFYSTSGQNVPVYSDAVIKSDNVNTFILYGKRFDYNNSWYLSSGESGFYGDLAEINTARHDIISAYKIPEDSINVVNDNVAIITLSANSLPLSGMFTLVTANSAGWVAWDHSITNILYEDFLYLHSDGISVYLQPNGMDLYIQSK